MAKRLTVKSVENLKPGPQRLEISDHSNGLFLVVQPVTGRKSWACRYRVSGKPAKFTLGSWPALSLADARKAAADALHEVARGNDPARAREAAKVEAAEARADTLAAVCASYLKREGGKLRTSNQRERILRRLIYPALGDRPVSEIRRSDIVRLLDAVEDANGQRMADVTLALLRRIMNWHATRSDTFVPPIVRGMGRQDPAEHRRSRVLDDGEVRAIWAATADPLDPFAATVRLLLLTAARRREIAELRWDEIDESGVWTLPASRSKTKKEVVRPLSRGALAVIEARPHIADSPYLLTAVGRITPPRVFSRQKAALDAASGVSDWRLHDLRRTSRSLLSRAGINTDIAERCLGHAMPTVRGIYDQHGYIDEMRHAFEALAASIERVVDPPQGNVVPLARA
jgi:integrase